MTPQVQLLRPSSITVRSAPPASAGVAPVAIAGRAAGPVVEDYLDRLSVVVPVRNEADNVLPLVEEIHAGRYDLITSNATGGSGGINTAAYSRGNPACRTQPGEIPGSL